MNKLINFFKKDSKLGQNATADASLVNPLGSFRVPAKELFIDPESPKFESQRDPGSSKVKNLASKDRSSEGYEAGLNFHDMDVCRLMQERIKAEIGRALEMEIDAIGLLLANADLELNCLQSEEPSNMQRRVHARRVEMDRHRLRLHEQKLLIGGNSGYAEFPLTTFSMGFRQGYQAYLDATLLMEKHQG